MFDFVTYFVFEIKKISIDNISFINFGIVHL